MSPKHIFILKNLVIFTFKQKFKWVFSYARFQKRHLIFYSQIIIFFFKQPLWRKWNLWLFQSQEIRFRKQRSVFLKFAFSTKIFVGFSLSFKEALWKYTESLRAWFIMKKKNFMYKFSNFFFLNSEWVNLELVEPNLSLFLLGELYKEKVEWAVFRSEFFQYGLLKDLRFFIINTWHFYFKISLKMFLYFFRYAEQIRLVKYNEYIMSHKAFAGELLLTLRKAYISLYFNWSLSNDGLDAKYSWGFRKALVKRVYLLYNRRPPRLRQYEFMVTSEALVITAVGMSFILFHFLQSLGTLRKFIFHLNRHAIRNTVRVVVYGLVMQKDRKWKWFHRLEVENLCDFIFIAFRQMYSVPVFQTVAREAEHRIFSWKLGQSSAVSTYIVNDLIMLNREYGEPETFWAEYFLSEVYLTKMVRLVVTNFFSFFFIRISGQLDFAYSNDFADIQKFYGRYRDRFVDSLLFYYFPIISRVGELLFGIDYFLWRLWYSYAHHSQPCESYLVSTSYDKLLQSRNLGFFRSFKIAFTSVGGRPFNFGLFRIYIILRDLFYKNLKCNWKCMLVLLFLKINPFPIEKGAKYLYDWKIHTSHIFFDTIASVEERRIDWRYITARRLLFLKTELNSDNKLVEKFE